MVDIALVVTFIALYCCGVWLSIWGANEVNQFLKQNREISDLKVLEKYKSLARRNMYMALLQMFILGTGSIAGLIALARNNGAGFIIMLIGNAIIFALGKSLEVLEKQVRSLPCADDDLAKKYRRISRAWLGQALPNF